MNRNSALLAASALASIVAASAALIALGVGSGPEPAPLLGPRGGPYRGSEPPPGIRAPDFKLHSYRGTTVRMRELRGKVVLVTFLDTACKTKCPIIASEIGAALRLLSPRERSHVVPLAISVNPASDNPGSVRAFLRRRHAIDLDFLLGNVQQLKPVWDSFHILAAAETGHVDVHSADVRLFDPRGVWVSTLHTGVDLTPTNLVHDARLALRNQARDQA